MSDTPHVVLLMFPFAGYDRGLLHGITRYSQLHGPWVFCLSGDHPRVPKPDSDSIWGKLYTETPITRMRPGESFNLRQLNATGIIGRIQSPGITRPILASGLPVIAVDLTREQLAKGNPLSRVSEIRADSHQAGRVAADHLLERGFIHFAFCGFKGRIWSQNRQDGFYECLQQHQYTSYSVYDPPRHKLALPWDREQPLVVAWLRSLPKPVGIMACNDVRGRHIIEAALAAGLQIPDDVAVVGVDDDRLLCNMANPPLSSVVLNLEHAGYQAAELLDGLMSGRTKQPQQIVVEALWVTARRSTDIVAVEDRHVAAALRFIRDHFRQTITIEEVVQESAASRRSLEIRFQRILGRSIREEIQRARLAWSKKLLLETNLSVEKIANVSGFSSLSYMSSVFRRELDLTPAQYRLQSRTP
ncbi:MAG: DNA-binding transcriptional regulator [Pirellulales bacterium]|nr:DNA-binding transcriptional regulator [Pirellulales bacterium]